MGTLTSGHHTRLAVVFDEDVGAVRRAVGQVAAVAPGVRQGDAELVVTELATNIIRHAPAGGYVLFRGVGDGIELLAVDHGASADAPPPRTPRSVAAWSLSAARGLGAGLATVARLSDTFDCYSATGGTVVLSRLGVRQPFDVEWCRWGAVNVPRGGETQSGDAWAVVPLDPTTVLAVVIDGLGHGPAAAAASAAGLAAIKSLPTADLPVLLQQAHEGMRQTRGGVIGLAGLRRDGDDVTFVGVGNVAGCVVSGTSCRYLASRDGVVGGQMRSPRPEVVRSQWEPSAALVLASDGVRSRWDLESYPGLLSHDPAVVAATVQRDHDRGTDDVAVLVVRGDERLGP